MDWILDYYIEYKKFILNWILNCYIEYKKFIIDIKRDKKNVQEKSISNFKNWI